MCALENQTALKYFRDRSAFVSMWAVHELTSGEPMIAIDSMKSHLIKWGEDKGNENIAFNSADGQFHWLSDVLSQTRGGV